MAGLFCSEGSFAYETLTSEATSSLYQGPWVLGGEARCCVLPGLGGTSPGKPQPSSFQTHPQKHVETDNQHLLGTQGVPSLALLHQYHLNHTATLGGSTLAVFHRI